LALTAVILAFLLWPKQRITQANFEKIQVGMSQEELHQLLGTPYSEVVELGLVIDPHTFLPPSGTPAELRQKGYKEYRWQFWASSEITIGVISDTEGQVVCRYSQPGQERGWQEFLRSLVFW
jgi:hypothetical protein